MSSVPEATSPEGLRQVHRRAERIRALALPYATLGTVLLVLASYELYVGYRRAGIADREWMVLLVVCGIGAIIALLLLAVARDLWRLRESAAMAIRKGALPLLLLFPAGTVLGIWSLYLLWRPPAVRVPSGKSLTENATVSVTAASHSFAWVSMLLLSIALVGNVLAFRLGWLD
jgi:hypothetical protein